MSKSSHEISRSYADYLLHEVGRDEASAIVLRNHAESLLDVIAYVATFNKCNFMELEELLKTAHIQKHEVRYDWISTLGRALALLGFQKTEPQVQTDLVKLGLRFLALGNRKLPKNSANLQFHKLEVELLAGEGRLSEALEQVINNKHLRNSYYGYLLSDLSNTALCGTKSEYKQWLEGFNRPFVENGLMPISASNSFVHSFDELSTGAGTPHTGGPKVSVIMTAYNPEPIGFQLAVESILNQTWRNLELIIVDDASTPAFRKTVERVAALDARIKVVDMSLNQGTYAARNKGISAATGDLITGQDSDDWSHPERIAHQVATLEDNPSAPGVVVQAIRLDDNLVRISPGRSPERVCEISLLTRRDLTRELGGYLGSRKGADSEFRIRLEKYVDKKIVRIKKPLYLTRLSSDSLSRADFKPGWSHPARRSFWNACLHWHRTSPPQLLRLSENNACPVPIPSRFQISPDYHSEPLDLVFAGDWRAFDPPQQKMVDEILTHSPLGVRMGILQLESIQSSVTRSTKLCQEVQTLVNNETVREVIPDEAARADTLVVGDPTCLQFASDVGLNFESDVTIIIPLRSGAAKSYRKDDCEKRAVELFKGDVIWQSVSAINNSA